MTLLDRIGSVSAAGATVALNFWPWLLAVFLAGGAVFGFGGFKLAQLIYQGEALKAERHLAQFDASIAKASAAGEAEAARRQIAALAAIAARNAATDSALAQIPGQVAEMLRPTIKRLGETLNDPKFSCMREPLPLDSLRLLERPGGLAPPYHGDPGPAADPAGLPNPARR